MNDIELVKVNNKFDWNFINNDVCNVTGNQRIISAVIHAVSLHRGELEQYYYQGMGCSAHDYVKLLQNDNTLSLVRSGVESACREIDGIRDANAKVEYTTTGIAIRSVEVTLDSGGGVTIGF